MNKIIILFFLLHSFAISTIHAQCNEKNPIPFSTNQTNITIWNGVEYLPFFIKGVNLGIAQPGTFPGELYATKTDYLSWFKQIKSLGFNCIRLYTLHYPIFYEALDSFNISNAQNPLFFFQGVWLNEDMEGYTNDLYFFTDTFNVEINENIDCVHGNKTIPPRFGKAYGTYKNDVSKWNIGYIIGREIYPEEILTTNTQHPSNTSFSGDYFSLSSGSPAETWMVSKLNYLVDYEQTNYSTQRPVSFSSWPSLDPIQHPFEPNAMEDTASVNLEKIILNNAKAGLFISYHAYPYYPDFIGDDPSYKTYYDNYGPNSYLGYLTDLKKHYSKYPLIIAEFGVPSSWGIAHYTSSGMNHGGFSEFEQGETNIRLLQSIQTSNCGGGIQFAWMDEWFKRTWITDNIEYIYESRVLWHNVTGAEQNFGLIGFQKKDTMQKWTTFADTCRILEINANADYDFFKLDIKLKNMLDVSDEIWIALDTYDENIGESILPNGDTLPTRSEFAIRIKNQTAELYVTEAYDLFGIWHNVSGPKQLYHSVVSDGAPWYLVRWKNSSSLNSVQYIGNLKVNSDFQPPSSKDAVTIYPDKIHIKLPWSLINVVDPSSMRVFNDDRNTPLPEDTISDGFSVCVDYHGSIYKSTSRFAWDTWKNVSNIKEFPKTSYWVMKDRLSDFNSKVISVCDSFYFNDLIFPVVINAENGLLKNDFDIDGDTMISLIIDNTQNGILNLNSDGSFTYSPNKGFVGFDNFTYCVFDQYSLSQTTNVILNVVNNNSIEEEQQNEVNNNMITLYPNPAKDNLYIEAQNEISKIRLFNSFGKLVAENNVNNNYYNLKINQFTSGTYILIAEINSTLFAKKILITN